MSERFSASFARTMVHCTDAEIGAALRCYINDQEKDDWADCSYKEKIGVNKVLRGVLPFLIVGTPQLRTSVSTSPERGNG